MAAKKGHAKIVQTLLKAGANINHQNKVGAAIEACHWLEMVLDAQAVYRAYLLISHSPIMSCSCITQTGCTALYYAAANGHLEIVKLLMQAGAKVLPNNVKRC